MNAQKLIIGVHVNENTMRTPNPHVPWMAEEIARDAAECRDEGAAVMHYHARTATGEPDHSAEAYAAIASAVRARCDILLAPSMANAPGNTVGQRLANITGTAADPRTRPDFLVMDMGCANMDLFDPDTRSFRSDDRVFVNSTATHRELLRIAGQLGLTPYLASFTIGWTRAVAAYLDMALLNRPVPLALILGGPEFLGTHPCTVAGLRAHLPFLPPGTEWIVSAYRGNVLDVAATAIELGGHIAIGTGDYHHAEIGAPGNSELVGRVRRLAEAAGREIATPGEVRDMFGMTLKTAQPREADVLLITEAGSIALVTSIGHTPVYVADSVSFGGPSAGAVLVTGSHGGISAGEYARRFGLLALVCNDAGFGKNNAGVAGLDALDAHGVAGIGAGHETARIGDGGDVWRNGVVTFANRTAAKGGVRIGQTIQQAVRVLVAATC